MEVLGGDDFAFRKGRQYGTVLINMTTHRPLHIFDGREGDDLAAWLQGHPEVKVICRDRSSGYGEGAQFEWVADAERGTLTPLTSFAPDLRRDFDVVATACPYRGEGADDGASWGAHQD